MHQKNREDANLAYGYKKCRIPTEKQREVTTTQLATHIKSKTTLFFFGNQHKELKSTITPF
jgi:hypothetical protein